jgi:hypothetical protein
MRKSQNLREHWEIRNLYGMGIAGDGRARKSPEAIPPERQPGGQGRALRGSVIAGIPQT